MITPEEVELCRSFKKQIDNSIKQFSENKAAIELQERELMILKQKNEEAMDSFNIHMDKCRKILATLKNQIAFKREVLRAEQQARNKYLLRSKRKSKTLDNLSELECQESSAAEEGKQPNVNT